MVSLPEWDCNWALSCWFLFRENIFSINLCRLRVYMLFNKTEQTALIYFTSYRNLYSLKWTWFHKTHYYFYRKKDECERCHLYLCVTFDLIQTRVTHSNSDLFPVLAEYFSYVIHFQKSLFASYKRCKSVLQSDMRGYKYAPDRLCNKNKKACVFSFLCLNLKVQRPVAVLSPLSPFTILKITAG